MSSSRNFPDIDLSHHKDHFPHLGRIITQEESISNRDKRTGERRSSKRVLQVDLGDSTDPKIASIVKRIKADDGPFAMKNHRILEWVTLEVLKHILSERDGVVSYQLWMSHAVDDILNHTDAILLAKTGSKTVYFGIDLTLSLDQVTQKLLAHNTWSRDVTIGKHTSRVPHVILYTSKDVIMVLTGILERACEQNILGTRIDIQKGIASLASEKRSLIVPSEIVIATPDRRNTLLHTPHHTEVIRDFMGGLGAQPYEKTTAQRIEEG